MGVTNCTKCGKIYNHIAGPKVCKDCRKSLEEEFNAVRKFIRRNPQATIPEIATECNSTIRQIREWIREERLSFTKDSAIGIDCEVCGTSIKTGKYCDACKTNIANDLNSVQPKREPVEEVNEFANQKKETKMRFLNKN